MNTALNVVHESEIQRQHARVRIPARIRFAFRNRPKEEHALLELSAGGFSFLPTKPTLKVGDHQHGMLVFSIDNLGLTMPVEFQVRSIAADSGRVGCQFHNLDPRDIATLRHLITAHLSGELVSVGELLTTLQRNNFSPARGDKGRKSLGMLGRMKALILSLAVLAIGVAAFGFIGKSLYELYFITHALSAKVSVPSIKVTMPREGVVQSLIGENQMVSKGAPIATFNTSMLELIKGQLNNNIQPARIEELLRQQMKGTLTSPCNCTLVRQLVADGQFAGKGDVVFELAPRGSVASVEALFPYAKLNSVAPGSRISFTVAGETQPRTGRVTSSNLNPTRSNDLTADIRVRIEPDEPLDNGLVGRPVEVSASRGPSFAWLMDEVRSSRLVGDLSRD
ncbi:alginate biosynthesis protein Alg44 [Metapseudomonas resinovorans]|uniref:PilZ domain-containing protein n=1 Tax=Metapseudomonas resinovorans TaxID=53412 RepID=UPI000985C403|nr:HlyD family efflux transporter periplasmic adaptor subunit [Pseudomonas resinovorans]GLZ86301.1 alginate biosynthesis protein Alg44 [Pseudomonas resinovorans]